MLNKYGQFGYCKYLAGIFGFYNKSTKTYTYRLINEDFSLESYLEKMVREKVIMLQLRDRSELIKKINAKQNGRLLKSKNTLNEVLKEKEIEYRIKEFKTTRYIEDSSGKKKKKVYKQAWKIEKMEPKSEGG
jgi:hypothetical protein